MASASLCFALLLVSVSLATASPLQALGHRSKSIACVEDWKPFVPLTGNNWMKPAGSSYFVASTAAVEPGAATWATQCKPTIAHEATHTADYQSRYGSWGAGSTLWISFYYRVEGEVQENFRLTLSKIYPTPPSPITLWESNVVTKDWVKIRLAVRENEEFAFRIAARHACSGSVVLSAISVTVDENDCDLATPPPPTTTTPTTTTTTTPTTTTTTMTTTTPATTPAPIYPDPTVTIRVKDLRIPDDYKKCDLYVWPQGTWKCDPITRITYFWNNQTSSQKHGEINNNHNIVYPDTIRHSAPVAKDSVVEVLIEVEDHDGIGVNDFIGSFRSSFVVPSRPWGQLHKLDSTAAYRGVGTVQVEFQAEFPPIV